MLRLTELKLPLNHEDGAIEMALLARLNIAKDQLISWKIFRRGHDARKRSAILLVYTIDFTTVDDAALLAAHAGDRQIGPAPDLRYRFVARAPEQFQNRPVVIGAGPCGVMAALVLAQMGFRPIIIERGKIVRERTKDTFRLWRENILTPESNVQYGEGGAGTFSDGKLYSQVKDPRHLGRKVLEEFVKAGAPEEILWVAKPHIGTFRLVTMVESIRETIIALGGEYRFETRVTDIEVSANNGERQLEALIFQNGERLVTNHAIFAVGHSARDTFQMLLDRGVYAEAKPFSIGFRVEHPQSIIDRARFGVDAGNKKLGPADYKLVHHAKNGRGVYSFCMCPGGTVVAATSEVGCVVTNGMSQYSRAERNANAAIVVGIEPKDYGASGVLAGMALQRKLESGAFVAGGGDYCAPAQLVGDFLAGRASTALGSVVPSYKPGVVPTDLASLLPDYAVDAIREAMPVFDRQIKGFAMHDALFTGVETRTSSPIRIKRDGSYQSLNTRGFYPAGEGAGYAGGILSAAIDGIEVAEALALSMVGSG